MDTLTQKFDLHIVKAALKQVIRSQLFILIARHVRLDGAFAIEPERHQL